MTDIEFFEDTHQYLVNGVITPSTTTLMRLMPEFKDMYKGVSRRVLANKAAYGDRIHEMVESIAIAKKIPDGLNTKSYEGIAIKRYIQLAIENDIKAISSEQLICFFHDGEPIFAGKYDLFGTIHGENALIDIKTTSKFHSDYLSVQLSMYRMAMEQQLLTEIPNLYCLWLPKKGLGRLVEVPPVPKETLLEKVIHAKETYSRP
ncbi:MAG: hypothetical protein E7190_00465 [Erysipelotrichaceae bacterium]|nr:hypothetical protein [Erysipelotrichaceae bacterium]